MKTTFCLLRNDVTSTSVMMDVIKLDTLRRWILSSVRNSGKEYNRYHFIAVGDLQDVTATDTLEELTGGVSGVTYKIVNKRELTGSHLEFDLEPVGTHAKF